MRWWNASVLRVPDLALTLWVAIATHACADVAFVTNQNDDTLSFIDLNSGSEIKRLSIPGKPAGISVSQSGAVYTVSPDSKTVRRLEAATGKLVAETKLDGGPIGATHDSGRGRLFISDWYNARIWVLDDQTLELQVTLETGAAPAGLALSDDGRFIASADKDADQVSIFDAETLQLLKTAQVGTRPFGLRFAPDGRLFVGNVGTNDVTVLEPETGATLATISVGERPYGVAFAKGHAFVTNQYEGTVSVIKLATLEHKTKVVVGEYPEGIDDFQNGARIVVANWFDNTVTIIDAMTFYVLGEVETGDGPRAFGEFVLGGQ